VNNHQPREMTDSHQTNRRVLASLTWKMASTRSRP